LWIRVQPTTGTKTFIVVARNPESKQIWAIGELCNRQSIDDARIWARSVIKRIRSGEGASAPVSAGQQSFRKVAEDWIELHVKEKRIISEPAITSSLKRYVYPAWGTRSINSIKKSDVTTLLDDVQRKVSRMCANGVLHIIRNIMNWHASREDDYNSPIVRGMRRINPKETRRKRVLKDDEIRVVWAATDSAHPHPTTITYDAPTTYNAFVRMLLLTAQRLDIVASMRWDDISPGGLWTIPADPDPVRSLRRKPNISMVQLPAMAREILRTLPRVEGNPFVFSATHGSNNHIANWDYHKRQLDARLPKTMPPWTHHDLRRTARTLMSRTKKVQRENAERALGHTIGGLVEGTYDCYPYLDEKSEALFQLAALLDEILHSPESKSKAITQNTALARDAVVNATAPTVRKTPRRPRTQRKNNGHAPTRIFSPVWQKVINMIGAIKDVGADVGQIVGFCEKAGVSLSRHRILECLSYYTKQGRLVRISHCRYMVANGDRP
jgi:integrase